MKRAKTAAVQLDQLIDLKNLALTYFQPMPEPLTLMPPSGTQLAAQQTDGAALPLAGPPSGTQLAAQQTAAAVVPLVGSSSFATSRSTLRRVINVPMDCARYDTEGMCFTGPMQVQWIGQLLQRPQQFVLHADGKHKLHHGRWVLMTLGTHYLRYDAERDQLSTSFAPLMYLMSKQVESGSEVQLGSANMLIDALNVLAVQVFGQEMKPGACVSDHCDAYRNAFKIGFPDAELLQESRTPPLPPKSSPRRWRPSRPMLRTTSSLPSASRSSSPRPCFPCAGLPGPRDTTWRGRVGL